MTQDDITLLKDFWSTAQGKDRVFFHQKFGEYLRTLKPDNDKRTGSQNDAMHLWFRQIAEKCRDAGIDAQLLFSKTVDLEVTDSTIKSLWHAVQQAYYKTESTTELKKHEQISKIADTLIRFFAERHTLEIPPFPSDDTKNNTMLQAMENLKREDYPEHTKTAFD